jgi:hypothetical protein
LDDDDPFGFGPNSAFAQSQRLQQQQQQQQQKSQEDLDMEFARQLEEQFKEESRRRAQQERKHHQPAQGPSRPLRRSAGGGRAYSDAELSRPFKSASMH